MDYIEFVIGIASNTLDLSLGDEKAKLKIHTVFINFVSLKKVNYMDLQSRKIKFVQEFLKVQNEELISLLEKILRKEIIVKDERIFEPMTQVELNKRIDQSESDFSKNRFKSSSELLTKYK